MVTVTGSSRHSKSRWPSFLRLIPCGGKIKPQTMIVVTLGFAVLFLLSLEPVVMYETELRSSADESSPLRLPTTPILPEKRPRQSSTRYGMVPKASLRTPVLYPVDTMIIDGKNLKIDNDRYDVDEYQRHDRVIPEEISSENTWIPITSAAMPEGDDPSIGIALSTTTTQDFGNHFPRVVTFTSSDDLQWIRRSWLPTIDLPSEENFLFEIVTQNKDEGNATGDPILPFEKPFHEQCEPVEHPQLHPTCNHLHELTMKDDSISILSTKGSWRTAWTVQNDTAVLKVLQFQRHFDDEAYRNHAIDVIVSDVLTASPYVINAYGFCGQSILQEWAPSSGRDYVKSYDVRNGQRLKVARDLARGLADLHALQRIPHDSFRDQATSNKKSALTSWKVPHPPQTVFAHNDINIANTIYSDGKVKWNDFNIGVLLRTRLGSNFTQDCGAPVKFRADLWRSPEEVVNASYVQLQYSDMYGFGNILYQIMTRHQPWTHKEPEGQLNASQVADRKRQGRLPTFPEKYLNATNKDLQILTMATMSCYHPVPSKRMTAYEMAHALSYLYDRRQHKKQISSQMLREIFLRR